jgi:hypothetical protein
MSEREFDDLFNFDRMISESISSASEYVDDFYLGEFFEEKEKKVEKKKKKVVNSKKPLATIPISTIQSIGVVQADSTLTESILKRVYEYQKRLEDIL